MAHKLYKLFPFDGVNFLLLLLLFLILSISLSITILPCISTIFYSPRSPTRVFSLLSSSHKFYSTHHIIKFQIIYWPPMTFLAGALYFVVVRSISPTLSFYVAFKQIFPKILLVIICPLLLFLTHSLFSPSSLSFCLFFSLSLSLFLEFFSSSCYVCHQSQRN